MGLMGEYKGLLFESGRLCWKHYKQSSLRHRQNYPGEEDRELRFVVDKSDSPDNGIHGNLGRFPSAQRYISTDPKVDFPG
jgi:hypothetical protein